jgi:hypothetical protein
MRRLRRRRGRPLFREKPSVLLHPRHRSCHRSSTPRKKDAGKFPIWAA